MNYLIDFSIIYNRDVSHLKDCVEYYPYNGISGRCIKVNIIPSNHVFSSEGDQNNFDFHDHNGNYRLWDYGRYNLSIMLPSIISFHILNNSKISEEYSNRNDKNYSIFRESNGYIHNNYDIFFYLIKNKSIADTIDMYIVSAYIRGIVLQTSKRKIRTALKEALFSNRRIPNR